MFRHPTRDPNGHHFQSTNPKETPLQPSSWEGNETYRLGIALFNHGYYWEAHEAWEALWHLAGRSGPIAEFLKGLIRLAAAGVKAREGRPAGVVRHADRARVLFKTTADHIGPDQTHFLGQNVRSLIGHAATLASLPDQIVNTVPSPVVVVMPFSLAATSSAGHAELTPRWRSGTG
ncbi:MAG: DUF309 domain-containing protein [Verrucomicrobia bacterium]|nr:DUF309 domain-containing protein [Verrucomicrobiota bacterium]